MTSTATKNFSLTVPGTNHTLNQEQDSLVFDQHRFTTVEQDIWDLVLEDRRPSLDAFATTYSAVRAAEGRELTASEVRKLPLIRADHPLAAMWQERAASFERLQEALAAHTIGMLIDIGAGCGWLSAHFAVQGWHAAAIDVTVDGGDGLAAARYHGCDLLLARAEMEALPFATSSVDLAVFNASLHYAHNVTAALDEAQRVLRPGGTLAVLDSPVFTEASAGRAMVAEFASHTERTLGLPPADLEGPGYVTQADLANLSFTQHGTARGLRSTFHAWRGARRAGREVATRPLLIATIGGQT